ncbi:MAG: methyltransferase domain-containing protein [Pseudomonadales bacterium]
MDLDSFYTEHWKDIEDERVARYEKMFQWRDGQRALVAQAEIGPGHRVLDVGAGPGFFAMGLAQLVKPGGRVDGVDINRRFVADATERAAGRDDLAFHHVQDHVLPFPDATFDRVVCKNVLEYVPDLVASLDEIKRVLKPGGRVHVIDSDWGFVVVEPWGKETVDRFFAAAAPAFREPYIGRRVPGALAGRGFGDIRVSVMPIVDREGSGMGVLTNMVSYIRSFSSMPSGEAEQLLETARQGIESGTYLFCLPQFLVTASAPE